MKITKPKYLKERKGIRGGYTTTVQDILPYLPDKECFFDCRHFVYDTTDGVLPFALTTRTHANNQQYLKVMNQMTAETICLNSKVNGKQPSVQDGIYDPEGIATACTTSFHPSIAIPQATKQGYIEVEQGGVFDAAYPESTTRRGRVCEGGKVTPTLCTSNELCVYEGVEYKGKKFSEGSGLYTRASDRFQRSGLKDMSRCLKAGISDAGVVQNYRIRKLTPTECFKLMGVTEENIDKIQAAGISNAQQYKMAGNSIVVDVLYHIFKKMFIEKENDNEQLTLF